MKNLPPSRVANFIIITPARMAFFIRDNTYYLLCDSKGFYLSIGLHDHPDDSTMDYHVYAIASPADEFNDFFTFFVNENCFDYEPQLHGQEVWSFPDCEFIKYIE